MLLKRPNPWHPWEVGQDVLVGNRHSEHTAFRLGRLLEFKESDSKTHWQAVVHWYGHDETGKKMCKLEWDDKIEESWYNSKFKLLFLHDFDI